VIQAGKRSDPTSFATTGISHTISVAIA
jgi:hypothetical protein